MERWLGRFSDLFYAALRIVAGVLFACHGAQKLFGAFGAEKMIGNPLMLTAGLIEFVGGVLIALGLLAGWAAFVASGQMAVAYFQFHFPAGFWTVTNGGTPAVLYCFLWLYYSAAGAGPWSLDAVLRRKRE